MGIFDLAQHTDLIANLWDSTSSRTVFGSSPSGKSNRAPGEFFVGSSVLSPVWIVFMRPAA